MIKINLFRIEGYLNELLQPEEFTDYCFNGIQIEGKKNIEKIVGGVSFNLRFLNKALEENADAVLVHHGIFGKDFFNLRGFMKKRVEKLIKNNISLIGYHLPLDAHPEYGNCVTLLNKLGLNKSQKFEIGYIGNYNKNIPFDDLLNKIKSIFPNRPPKYFKNTKNVNKVAIITGGGGDLFDKLEGKVDTYITGETKERTKDTAKETNMNYIDVGHYVSERFGVKNLLKLINKNFNIETKFVEAFNTD